MLDLVLEFCFNDLVSLDDMSDRDHELYNVFLYTRTIIQIVN